MPGGTLISILTMNRLNGAKACLHAVQTFMPGCRIILTDNASSDGTAAWCDQLAKTNPNVTVFHERENTGFQFGHKRAFRIAAREGYQFFLCLNDDVIVSQETLDRLTAPFVSNPCLALCGDSHGCSELNHEFHGQPGRLEYVEASSMVVNIPIVSRLRMNLFSDELVFAYGEDSDLSLFVREKGFHIQTVDAKVQHSRSQTTNSTPQLREKCRQSQEHNHAVSRRRWGHYLHHRTFNFPIVVKRSYAIGDVLLITPIIRAISQSNPLSPIYVQTDSPELFTRNPHVNRAAKSMPHMEGAMTIDLDGSYENMPMTHIVEAYEAAARQQLPGLEPVELKTELHPDKGDMEWATLIRLELAAGSPKLALIGSDPTTWRGKNWPEERFEEIRARLHQRGWKTATVGTKKAEVKTTIHQLAALLSLSQLFIGNDSFPLHAAQAMGVPTVGLFGPTLPRFIFTQGSKAAAASAHPAIPCAGERHRVTGKTFVDCNASCINSITADSAWAAIERLEVL